MTGGQARIGNYEKDRREPSITDLQRIAAALGTAVSELLGEYKPHEKPMTDSKGFLVIRQHTAVGSTGSGRMNDHVEVNGGLAFKEAWLARMGVNPANLHVIYAEGMSMDPTIADGDVILMDDSQIEPKNGKIYVIRRPEGDLIIKRLVHSLTGRWIIRSDNDDKRQYPDDVLDDAAMSQLTIVGRAIWHAGTL